MLEDGDLLALILIPYDLVWRSLVMVKNYLQRQNVRLPGRWLL
jgi:hypothetical protein